MAVSVSYCRYYNVFGFVVYTALFIVYCQSTQLYVLGHRKPKCNRRTNSSFTRDVSAMQYVNQSDIRAISL
jgi:hypothetical protein